MELEYLVFLLVGVLLGGTIGIAYSKLKFKKGENHEELTRARVLDVKVQDLEKELKGAYEKSSQDQALIVDLNAQKAGLEADYRNLEEKLLDQKKELSKLHDKFSVEFKNLANEIFEEKSKKFVDQNKTNLNELLNPLGQKIQEFEKKVEQNSKESLQWNSSLKTQLDHLKDLNQKITKEAENLTNALKGDVKAQGNWGEIVLERILEESGLRKDNEYFTQESFTSEQGRRLRPDVIIKLPENKHLVIDSKVSLLAYDQYANTDDPKEKDKYLKEHILSIRAHIKGLSEKNYHTLFDGGSLDYVLMFMPIEPAFALVVQYGGSVYSEAHDKSIIIVSPTTLMATLKTVASIWKHEYQNQNALEIARQGGALYDKFKSFVDDLIEVGKSIDRSKNQYGLAMNKLVDGKDNLIRKTERLRELGSKTTKTIDAKILNRAKPDPEEDTPKLF